jgi:tetratricopeptide (TPR) repeat protein
MSDELLLDQMCVEWEEALQAGRDLPATELCARQGCLHLAERLTEEIAKLRHFAAPAPAVPPLPARIGRYRVDKPIASGGMGDVVRVLDDDFDRPLAMKVLQQQYRGMTDLEERFLREARLTGQLQHPGIPPVQEKGRLAAPDNRPYFIMKLVKGRNLHQLLRERASPQDRAGWFLEVFEKICQTVAYTHTCGVIHRDLKPSNVMVGSFGEVQVMDWGLAKVLRAEADNESPTPMSDAEPSSTVQQVRVLAGTAATAVGTVQGTPSYMAPEQARGEVETLHRACDVFGLGGILCDILTGKPPFAAGSDLANLRLAMNGDLSEAMARLAGCGADAELIALAKRCLAAETKDRFPDAGAVAKEMTAYQELVRERLRQAEVARGRAEVRTVEECKRLVLERQKRRVTLWLATAVLLVLMAGVLGTTVALLRAWKETDRAETAEGDASNKAALAENRRGEADKERARAVAAEQEATAKAKLAEQRRHEAETQKQIAASNEEQAKEQAEIARQVKDFLVRAFRMPGHHFKGDKVTVAQILEQAVLETDTLDAQPRVQEEVLEAIGLTYLSYRLPQGAPVWEKVVMLRSKRLGPNHLHTLNSKIDLAMAFQYAGQSNAALPLLEEIGLWLTGRPTGMPLPGADTRFTLTFLNKLGVAYLHAVQFKKAVPVLEEALDMGKKKFGSNDHQTLVSMNNLALAYRNAGQFKKAVPLFQKALSKLQAMGDIHNALITMGNLAVTYERDGQLKTAMQLYQEALKQWQKLVSRDDPHILLAMSSLAGAYRDDGQLLKAIQLCEEALEKQRMKLGPDHPETLDSMNTLARTYQRAGRTKEALSLFEMTLEKRKLQLGLDHPDTLISMNNLARAYWEDGQLKKAVPLFEETLEKCKVQLGPDHPETLNTMGNLCSSYHASGQLKKALPLYEETLKRSKEQLGPDHPLTLVTMNNLAVLHLEENRPTEAEVQFAEWLQRQRPKLPSDDLNVAKNLNRLSKCRLALKKFAEAEPLLRDSLDIYERKLKDSAMRFDTESLLGASLAGQQKFAAAEPHLVNAFKGLEALQAKLSPNEKALVKSALERVIDLYESWEKPAEAAKWRALKDKQNPPMSRQEIENQAWSNVSADVDALIGQAEKAMPKKN